MELEVAPEKLHNGPKPQGDGLEEIDLAGSQQDMRPIFITKSLLPDFRDQLIDLLKAYEDVFAWTYDEMPGFDVGLVTHRLAISLGAKPVKQSPQNFRSEVQL